MEKNYFEIGSHKNTANGDVFSCGKTDNGYCYKSEKAIKERKGVCYIAESAFEKCLWEYGKVHPEYDEEGNLIVNENDINALIDCGCLETWDSARKQVEEIIEYNDYGCFDKRVLKNCKEIREMYKQFAEYIAECALYNVDWQCLGTYLNEIDIDEELDYFIKQRFVQFAKERIKADNDDTDVDYPVFEKNLFGFLGDDCFVDDEFNLTDWDSLIDKWEDEPNY